jgi:cytosine/uracil/thiamine/allantoin permease
MDSVLVVHILVSDIPPAKTTCQYLALFALYPRITDAYNCGTYELASTMLAVGLSWQQSLAAIIAGHLFLSWTITLNGTIGARLNVPFREHKFSHSP